MYSSKAGGGKRGGLPHGTTCVRGSNGPSRWPKSCASKCKVRWGLSRSIGRAPSTLSPLRCERGWPKRSRSWRVTRSVIAWCNARRVAKAFSAGGDVRELIALWHENPDAARKALADEYALDSLIDASPSRRSPSLVARSWARAWGSPIRHASGGRGGYRFAMPETMIGLFPDVGCGLCIGASAEARGLYLGLTGRTIGRADAFALGLLRIASLMQHSPTS